MPLSVQPMLHGCPFTIAFASRRKIQVFSDQLARLKLIGGVSMQATHPDLKAGFFAANLR